MKQVTLVFERLSFMRILSLWLITVIVFSFAFYGLSFTQNQHLIYRGEPIGNDVFGFGNSVYFSFITATTIGYGDIAPTGLAKVFAIIEAMASIILFGIFIGKIVSIKQEEILEEVREISIEDATNNAVSQLYIFRNHIGALTEQLKTAKASQKVVKDFGLSQEDLQHALQEFHKSNISTSEDKEKALMHISLVANSINFSLSKLVELLDTFNTKKIDWKKESTTTTLAESQKVLDTLYGQYNAMRKDDELSKKVGEKLEDLNKTLATMKKSIGAS
jgi:hypothetical protein